MLYKSEIYVGSFSKIIDDEKKQSISYTFLTMPKIVIRQTAVERHTKNKITNIKQGIVNAF